MQIMTAKLTTLRMLYVHVVSNSVMFPQILYDIVLYVSENTMKIIGHHSRLRAAMGQSYLICACTRGSHERYSSVNVTFAVARNIVYKSKTREKT